jgi:YesN/AraC family two-component response regulator
LKILVVEDEDIIRESIQADIRRMDHTNLYTVYAARSVAEATAIYDSHKPEMVITDINMPQVSGLRLVEKIRKQDEACVIFILSAYDDFDYVRHAFLAGANDYILKPISYTELENKIISRSSCGTPTNEAAVRDNLKMEGVLDFIQKNLSRAVSMREAADYAAFSYNHFSKLFKEYTGLTFPHYLLKIRMETAKEYMSDPYVKITSIAAKVGYRNNIQHFSRDFTKYTGVSPTEYKRGRNNPPVGLT